MVVVSEYGEGGCLQFAQEALELVEVVEAVAHVVAGQQYEVGFLRVHGRDGGLLDRQRCDSADVLVGEMGDPYWAAEARDVIERSGEAAYAKVATVQFSREPPVARHIQERKSFVWLRKRDAGGLGHGASAVREGRGTCRPGCSER